MSQDLTEHHLFIRVTSHHVSYIIHPTQDSNYPTACVTFYWLEANCRSRLIPKGWEVYTAVWQGVRIVPTTIEKFLLCDRSHRVPIILLCYYRSISIHWTY